MSDTLILVMATIWSLFAMALISWKLNLNAAENQLVGALDRAVEDHVNRFKSRSELVMENKAQELLKDTLVEAKVVGRHVELIFTKRSDTTKELT